MGTACAETMETICNHSPGLEAPTLITMEALTSRIIGLNWQVSDRRVTSHVTSHLTTSDRHVATSDRHVATSDRHVATSDRHVATSDRHVATNSLLCVFSSPITHFSTECIRQRKNLMFVMHHLGSLSDRQCVL